MTEERATDLEESMETDSPEEIDDSGELEASDDEVSFLGGMAGTATDLEDSIEEEKEKTPEEVQETEETVDESVPPEIDEFELARLLMEPAQLEQYPEDKIPSSELVKYIEENTGMERHQATALLSVIQQQNMENIKPAMNYLLKEIAELKSFKNEQQQLTETNIFLQKNPTARGNLALIQQEINADPSLQNLPPQYRLELANARAEKKIIPKEISKAVAKGKNDAYKEISQTFKATRPTGNIRREPTGISLTSEERRVARQFGIKESEYLKWKK